MKLNVGCGRTKLKGYINLDKRADFEPEICWDIESIPWCNDTEEYFPHVIEDDTYDEIRMSHIVEHIKPWLIFDVIDEVWRVLKYGGPLTIFTPTAGSFRYFIDPTHCCPWTVGTPQFFNVDNPPMYYLYAPKPWVVSLTSIDAKGDIQIKMLKVNLERRDEALQKAKDIIKKGK